MGSVSQLTLMKPFLILILFHGHLLSRCLALGFSLLRPAVLIARRKNRA